MFGLCAAVAQPGNTKGLCLKRGGQRSPLSSSDVSREGCWPADRAQVCGGGGGGGKRKDGDGGVGGGGGGAAPPAFLTRKQGGRLVGNKCGLHLSFIPLHIKTTIQMETLLSLLFLHFSISFPLPLCLSLSPPLFKISSLREELGHLRALLVVASPFCRA